MQFDLSFVHEKPRMWLQHAIDGANKAAALYDPGAWDFVSEGSLIKANTDMAVTQLDHIAVMIFAEMEQDLHSGYSAGWTVSTLTEIAKNYGAWRTTFLVKSLEKMNEKLCSFILSRFTQKFPEEQERNWFIKRDMVLHDLEYSYLVKFILTEEERNVLEYLLKMENVSHLGNEVLFDQIDEHLKVL